MNMRILFISWLISIFATTVYAGGSPAPGSLDTAFGSKGVVVTAFSAEYDQIEDLAIQPDGKIVAVGWSSISNNSFSLARYNTNGSLDTTFGTGGKISTSFSPSGARAHSVAIQSDGKIIAGGGNGANADIARYNPDGSLDNSFDGDGKLELLGGAIGDVADLAVQSDGKIVAVGEYSVLARLNPDGSLDRNFGSAKTGLVPLPFAPHAVAIHTDGKIIVGGNSSSTSAFVAARYNADGTSDTGFGTGGIASAQITGVVSGMVVHPLDGYIVLAGRTTASSGYYNFALVRFGPSGVLDNTFGTGGTVVTAVTPSHSAAQDIALQIVNGAYKYVVSGYANVRTGRTEVVDFALVRYTVSGTLDSTFGSGGIVTTAIQLYANSYAVVVQADNKIVAGGAASQSGTAATYDFALARYNP